MFGCGAPRAVQVQTPNGASKDPVPLLAHFDVNKTIIQSDSIQMKSIDQGIREGVSELFWGHIRKEGEKVEWEWTKGKPSCAPPSDDVCFAGAKLVNYAQYCKEVIKDKAQMKEAIRSFSLVADKPVREEMERLRQLTMKRMQLEPEVRGSSEAEAAGIRGPTFNMFPTLFHLVATLQRMHRPFALVFRSFGADHEKIQTEWNAFCELRHPIFSRLIDDIGPMNGTVASVPDRRIHSIHTLYRDATGPVLMLDTFTNGPEDASWDSWAKTKPKPKVDTRNGREYIRRVLKAKTVEGYAGIQKWMKQHTQMQATTAIKDDWAWWQFNGEQAHAGKLLCMIGGRKPVQQLFFDDNIEFEDARIVDCREVNGTSIPFAKSLKKLCVKVNPVEAMLDNDYFLRKVLAAQGDHLDAGASLIGLQKQLTEVEEEKSAMQRQLAAMNLQLKTLAEENRRMKLQRRINIRDEGELQSLLAKDVELSIFGQGDYRTLSDLYNELEQGACWLEVNEQGKVVRVLDMLYLKILFKDSLLIESHEHYSSGRGNTRNYFPGVLVSLKDTSIQQALDRWFETGLQVDMKKCVETELLPVSAPDAPMQQSAITQDYPIPCVVHQSIGTFIIPEKEVDLHKDVLAKIGLPGAKHFTTTEKDMHGSTITRVWRWDKQATWEAHSSGNKNQPATAINVAATCEKIFAGHPRKEVYSRIILEMFERFEAQKLTGGFSGSVVIRVQPFEATGRPGEPCIVKLDAHKAIHDEWINSVNVFEALPDRAARILGEPVKGKDANGEEYAAMRLELAGACWNVPELAQGSTNLLSTFKDLLLYESEQMLLQNSSADSGGTRPFGNVNSVLAETFGPGGVVSALRKGRKGLRRSTDKPLLWGWYTLKGKESEFNPLTSKKGEYPPSNAIKRLYKDHFGGDLPPLKETVVGTIKPELERLSAKANKDLCPLIGLAHGDLNAANIMIDALDAVWLIDFATSVELPLFTDMCKFEMACLFEYAVIPITPKLLVEFASNQESMWKNLNIGDWLRVDDSVAVALLQKLVALAPERLAGISQGDLDKLIEEVVSKSGKKPSSQRKMSRAMKARLVVDESMTEAALTYCCNISNALLNGDYIGETLEINNIPLPEGKCSRGASSLRFFMEICVSIRRFMSQDILGVLREQSKAPGGIELCDVLSLQLWLPFLRESYRIIGYRDVAPQCKLWSIYHCSKVAKNVTRVLEQIKKNFSKLHVLPMLADFKADMAKKSSLQREKTTEVQGFFGGGFMEAESHWIFYHGTQFPHNELHTRLVRKMHSLCESNSNEPGFFAPVWQVMAVDESVLNISFDTALGTSSTTKQGASTQLDVIIEVPGAEAGVPPVKTRLGFFSPSPGRKDQPSVMFSSRLFRLTTHLLARRTQGDDSFLDGSFSLGSWSGGIFSEAGELLGKRKSNAGRGEKQQEVSFMKYMTLDAKVVDQSGKERQKLLLVLGAPVYCYPPGSRLCVDVSGDGSDQATPLIVVSGLADSGLYVTRSAERPAPETENEFDPTPMNHTFRSPTNYTPGTQLIIKDTADAQIWSDAEVTGPASQENGFKYSLKLKASGSTISRSLDIMNSGRPMQGLTSEIFEEEMNKIKIFFRARYSSIIDSLSGGRLDIKECAPPTLTFATSHNPPVQRRQNTSRGWGTSGSSNSGAAEGGEARTGWSTLLLAVEFCEKMVPTCQPNSFLILGEPGSGKSCLVCRLIMETLDRYSNLVPMVLPVSDIVRRSGQEPELYPLSNAVIHDWFDKYLRMTWGEDSLRYCMVVQAIKMNRVLFLFEGLEDGGRLTPVIEACIRKLILDRHLVVVTSRPILAGQSMLEEMQEHMTVMRLGNLLDEHKRQIAHARLGLEGIGAFDQLFKKLRDSQSMGAGQEGEDSEGGEGKEDVFGNPMMLSMLLCYLQTMQRKIAEGKDEGGHEDGGEGATITAVYRVALDVMLQRVQSSNQAERHQKDKKLMDCRRILQRMAITMQLRRSHAIGVNEVEPLLPPELTSMWANLKAAVQAGSAMFLRMTEDARESEAKKSEFHFLVKGFQNYFAANAVAHDGFEGLPDLVSLLTEPWWAQMLEMLAEAFPKRYVELIEQRLIAFSPKDGESFLHIAARAGHRPVFQLLHLFSEVNKAALSTRNRDMRTPLHIAAEKGNTALCAHMLDHGAPIDAEDSNERLAMHVAMQYGAFQTGKFLLHRLQEREDKNARRQSATAYSSSKSRKGPGQVEHLAQRIMNGMQEEDFRKEAFQTFPELQYFSTKERDWKDRTVGGILAVFWIAANQYGQFVRSQEQEIRLTKSSWETLQTWAKKTVGLMKNSSVLGAMLVFVAIANLGKIKPFCTAFAPEFDEHTEALASILQKYPVLVPSFAKLDTSLQQTILTSLKADFNFGQFLQAENLPASLYTVKQKLLEGEGGGGNMDSSVNILSFFLFKIFAQMCGILGPKSLEGSLFMQEFNYTNFKTGIDMLQHLERESAQEVYDRFLAERAKQQSLTFNTSNPEARAIVRLACLSRIFEPKGGAEVAEAFKSLDADKRKRLTNLLNTDGIIEKPGFLLYGSPNLMSNSRDNTKIGPALGMQVILRIYEAAAKEYMGSEQQVVTIMVDELAVRAKTCMDPEGFAFTPFDISRTTGYKSDSQGTARTSPWQLVNDGSVIDGTRDDIDTFAQDVLRNGLRESVFLRKLPLVFPELKFLMDNDEAKQILGQTKCAFLVLFWTTNHHMEAFTRSQSLGKKLTEKSWSQICGLVECIQTSSENMSGALVVMLLHALGKLPKFQMQLAPKAESSTEVLEHVLDTCPKVLPSYACLSGDGQRLARVCLTRHFDFRQFLFGESVPASLRSVKEMLEQPDVNKQLYIKTYLCCIFAQLAASLGPQSLDGSIYMNEDKWHECEVGLEAIRHLISESEPQVYDRFYQSRADLAGLSYSATKAETRALARLACICSITTMEGGQTLLEAFESLQQDERTALSTHLCADGITQKPGFLLNKCQEFMANAIANQEVGLRPALRILLKVFRDVARDFGNCTRPILKIQLEKLASFAGSFTGSVTFQDLPFELEHMSDHEAVVIPKLWIPINKDNKAVLDSLNAQGRDLASDVLKGTLSEKQFKGRLGRVFPELSYFEANADTQRQQTYGAMLSVLWLVSNQHEHFIRSQPEDEQLSKQSWAWIQDWMTEGVKVHHEESLDAMLTFMAIHALGKIKEFREELAPGFNPQMHDVALAHILETQPEVVPSFLRLAPHYQRLIVDSLSVDFEFSQFLQAENVPANLMVVKEKLEPHGEDGFAFFCFRIFVQMCGKLGTKSLMGSLFMTESQFLRFRPGLDALQQLKTMEAGSAYNTFLLLQGSKALSRFASPEHHAIARLLCLGSASDHAHGDALCRAFDELEPAERARLTSWLTADGINQRPGYVLCDAPAYLQNAESNQFVGLSAALSMLVSVQQMCSEGWGVHKVYLHLDELSNWAKDAGADEFMAAQVDVAYQDLGDARIFRVQVIRPQAGPSSGRSTSCTAVCCRILAGLFLSLLLLTSLAGAVGLGLFPDTARPALRDAAKPYFRLPHVPSDLAVKAFGAIAAVAFLLMLLLCRAGDCCARCCCCCCGRSSRSPAPQYRSSGSKPLLCNYTLLRNDSPV